MLSREAKKQYVEQGGVSCPFCASDAISADKPELDGAIVVVPVECESCGKRWHERYDLVGIYELGDDGSAIFDDETS